MKTGWLETPFLPGDQKIWVAGAGGLVGSAALKKLKSVHKNIINTKRIDLDLFSRENVRRYLHENKPDIVILAAAHVGGIGDNAQNKADFLSHNLAIQAHVIEEAYRAGVRKLLFLGSSCIYPKNAPQPIKEEALLSGPLEPTNEAYALAKIAGVKMCEYYRAQYGCDFITAMPCNLYGPGDRFDLERSHVIPALMMKAHAAKISGAAEMVVWGSGRPLREFLYVDDLAEALVFLLENYSGAAPVNVGSGVEVSIADLAQLIADVVGFEGRLVFDESKPDGTARKLLDSSRINEAGWKPRTDLREGLEETYAWYLGQL